MTSDTVNMHPQRLTRRRAQMEAFESLAVGFQVSSPTNASGRYSNISGSASEKKENRPCAGNGISEEYHDGPIRSLRSRRKSVDSLRGMAGEEEARSAKIKSSLALKDDDMERSPRDDGQAHGEVLVGRYRLRERRKSIQREEEEEDEESEEEEDDEDEAEDENENRDDDEEEEDESDEENEVDVFQEPVIPQNERYSFRDRSKAIRDVTRLRRWYVEEEEEEDSEEGEGDQQEDENASGEDRAPGRARYALRNREKVQREVLNVKESNPQNEKPVTYAEYARRVERRVNEKLRRRRERQRNRKLDRPEKRKRHRPRRRHYDSSSESAGGEVDLSSSEDEDVSFRRAEKRRLKRELSAIQPLNSSGSSKDMSRADTAPLEIDSSISWDSVGGLSEHIRALKEMVMLPLLYPEIYDRFSISPAKGVLFHGPPGTGKTLTARALANTCSQAGQHVSFFMRKGADCLSKWVGEAERQLRLLFEQAKRHQPSIIFFDEIDGLAPVRSSRQDQIHASIVSTLLALMDGLDQRGQVVVIGATNRVDAIDPALRRPGRFDRELLFQLPGRKQRKEIFDIHTKAWQPPLTEAFKEEIAEKTVGYCGADLKALCTEATFCAIRRRYPQVYMSSEKLLLDMDSIRVLRVDFRNAMNAITPAAHRSAVSSAAALPKPLMPLLERPLLDILRLIRAIFPMWSGKGCTEKGADAARPSLGDQLAIDEEEESTAVYGIINRSSCDICRKQGHLTRCRTCPASIHLQCLPAPRQLELISNDETDSFICHTCTKRRDRLHSISSDCCGEWAQNLTSTLVPETHMAREVDLTFELLHSVHRPRFLIYGQAGMGQSRLVAAVLNEMETLQVISIALPRLIAEPSTITPEESLVRQFMEARRSTPCILFLPNIDKWWQSVSPIVRTTLTMLLDELSADSPILFLATASATAESLGTDLAALFNVKDNEITAKSFSLSPSYLVVPPSTLQRKMFFADIFRSILKPPKTLIALLKPNSKVGRRLIVKKTTLEKLPVAPMPKKEPPGQEDIMNAQKERDEHYLRELRIFLDRVLEFCRKERRYTVFFRKIDPEEVPDYYKIIKKPMDLQTMTEKLDDGEYTCLEQFMDDIKLIVSNAEIYNPSDSRGRSIMHNACNMLDQILSYAHRFKREQGYDLFAKCRELTQRLSGSKMYPGPRQQQSGEGNTGVPSQRSIYPATECARTPQGVRTSARLQGKPAPEIDIELIAASRVYLRKEEAGESVRCEGESSVDRKQGISSDGKTSDRQSLTVGEAIQNQAVLAEKIHATTTASADDSARDGASNDCNKENRPQFELQQAVVVAARTQPGMNKLGGNGFITKINGDGTYEVKYILGGREKRVEARFIRYYVPDEDLDCERDVERSNARTPSKSQEKDRATPVNDKKRRHMFSQNKNVQNVDVKIEVDIATQVRDERQGEAVLKRSIGVARPDLHTAMPVGGQERGTGSPGDTCEVVVACKDGTGDLSADGDALSSEDANEDERHDQLEKSVTETTITSTDKDHRSLEKVEALTAKRESDSPALANGEGRESVLSEAGVSGEGANVKPDSASGDAGISGENTELRSESSSGDLKSEVSPAAKRQRLTLDSSDHPADSGDRASETLNETGLQTIMTRATNHGNCASGEKTMQGLQNAQLPTADFPGAIDGSGDDNENGAELLSAAVREGKAVGDVEEEEGVVQVEVEDVKSEASQEMEVEGEGSMKEEGELLSTQPSGVYGFKESEDQEETTNVENGEAETHAAERKASSCEEHDAIEEDQGDDRETSIEDDLEISFVVDQVRLQRLHSMLIDITEGMNIDSLERIRVMLKKLVRKEIASHDRTNMTDSLEHFIELLKDGHIAIPRD